MGQIEDPTFWDPMHVFKNVGQAIWDHIIGKKDSLSVWEDMRAIRHLPPSATPRMGPRGKMVLPKSPWILSRVEQERKQESRMTAGYEPSQDEQALETRVGLT